MIKNIQMQLYFNQKSKKAVVTKNGLKYIEEKI